MNTLYLYLIAAGGFILPLLVYVLLRFVLRDKISNYDKVSSIVYKVTAGLTIFAIFMALYHIYPAMLTRNGAEKGTLNLNVGTNDLIGVPYGNNRIANFFAWFGDALFFPGATIACLIAFLPFRAGKLFNKWIQLPIAILEFGFLFNLENALLGEMIFNYQSIMIASMVGLSLSTTVVGALEYRADTHDINSKEFLEIMLLFAAAFFVFLPVNTLPTLCSTEGIFFGKPQKILRVYDLNELHRFVIYFGVGFNVLIYFLFRNKEFNFRKVLLLVLSLGALKGFTAIYNGILMFPLTADGVYQIDVKMLPIHLCHTAMYVVPLCVAFNLKKLFYFTYFINVFGAFCAIFMPNTGETLNIFSPDVVTYWINHIGAAFLPLMAVALKIFERPKFKQVIYSLIGFLVYFVVIMFMNAWLSNYTPGGTDYLFMNSDFIIKKIITNEVTRNAILNQTFSWKWGELTFTIRPLYQSIFFSAYAVIAFCMWFVYSLFYRIGDAHWDLHCKLVIARKENITMKERKAKEEIVSTDEISLVFEDFTKRYGNSPVLSADHINLNVAGGQIFGFLGPNGAGKSTSIKSAIGIQPVTEGHIFVCGHDVTTEPVKAKKLIGYVPDHYALYEKLTGREYINYIADLYGVSKADRDARIARFIDLFELQQAFDNRMQTYSHGMKQKIAIMAALVHNPKIWILDEPLTGLDPQSIFQVKECMKQHAAEGNIVFFSSHIIDVVEKLCDRIAVVKKGKIIFEESMKNIERDHPEGLESFYMNLIHDNGDLD